jgi:hypothetical protein
LIHLHGRENIIVKRTALFYHKIEIAEQSRNLILECRTIFPDSVAPHNP